MSQSVTHRIFLLHRKCHWNAFVCRMQRLRASTLPPPTIGSSGCISSPSCPSFHKRRLVKLSRLLQYHRIFAFNSTPHSLGLRQASPELASLCGHTSQPHLLTQLYRWNKVIKSTESLVALWLYTVWVDNDSSLSANNGALHSVINAAGFWKALWKSEAVGADDVEGAIEGMWQHALLQLRAIEGLHDSSPCTSADDARAMLQRAHCSDCPAFGPGTYELDFSFMRLSQRRSFKVEPSLLEWICFSRTPEAITITCVPVLPPPHVLNGRPPSSYLPMCDRALPPSFSLL